MATAHSAEGVEVRRAEAGFPAAEAVTVAESAGAPRRRPLGDEGARNHPSDAEDGQFATPFA
jgi:hypothetical protein